MSHLAHVLAEEEDNKPNPVTQRVKIIMVRTDLENFFRYILFECKKNCKLNVNPKRSVLVLEAVRSVSVSWSGLGSRPHPASSRAFGSQSHSRGSHSRKEEL